MTYSVTPRGTEFVIYSLMMLCCTIVIHSRNLLSVIPPCLCHLKQLEVLLAGNNRLVSLPEEIGKLQRLQQLVRQDEDLLGLILCMNPAACCS